MTSTKGNDIAPARRVAPDASALRLAPGWIRILGLVLATMILFEFYNRYVQIFWGILQGDYVAYYQSMGQLLRGGDPYSTGYVYPLFFDLLIFPLAFVGDVASLNLFRVLNIAILGGFGWLLGGWLLESRGATDPGARWIVRLGALAGVLWFTPASVMLRMGQADGVVTGFFLGAWAMTRRDRPLGAGAMLGCAVLTKVAPLVAVPALLVWRPRRVALGGIVIAAVYWLLLFATGLWRWEWNFLVERLPQRAGETFWNQISFMQIAARYPVLTFGIASPVAMSRIFAAIVVACYIGTCFRGFRRGARAETMLGLGVTSSLIVLPVLQYHHLVSLLVPLGIAGVEAWRRGDARLWIAPVAAWLLLALPNRISSSTSAPHFLEFVPFLGLLTLWIYFVWVVWKGDTPQSVPAETEGQTA